MKYNTFKFQQSGGASFWNQVRQKSELEATISRSILEAIIFQND